MTFSWHAWLHVEFPFTRVTMVLHGSTCVRFKLFCFSFYSYFSVRLAGVFWLNRGKTKERCGERERVKVCVREKGRVIETSCLVRLQSSKFFA